MKLKRFISKRLIFLALFAMVLAFCVSFYQKQAAKKSSLIQSVQVRENDLKLAIIDYDPRFIEVIGKSIFSEGWETIQITSSDKVIFSFPTETLYSQCLFKGNIKLVHYNQAIGKVNGCLKASFLITESLLAPTFLFSLIIILLLVSLGPIWSLLDYKTQLLDILNMLEKWSSETSEELPNIANIKSLGRDNISHKFIKLVHKGLLDRISIIKQSEKDAAIAGLNKMLAHDVRKPFTKLKMVLSSLGQIKDDPKELAFAQNDIEKSIRNVEVMISDIVDFSREVTLEVKPKPLLEALDLSLKLALQGYSNLNINFKYAFKADKQPLIDEERMARVFCNILTNAIEAITIISQRNSGTITLSSRSLTINNDNFIEICIANDGLAINEDDLDKLFEPFYTSGKQKGTGLGLASAKKIIKLHKGHIFAHNLEDNKGVEFIIQVPSSTKDEMVNHHMPSHTHDLFPKLENGDNLNNQLQKIDDLKTGFKILLLEDEVLYRAGVKNLINSNPTLKRRVTLYDTSTVDEALLLAKNEKPAYAIVDIDLGDAKDGFQFIQEARSKYPKIKIMIHSNRSMSELKSESTSLGVDKIIAKPLSLSNLVEFLKPNKDTAKEKQMDHKKVTPKVFFCDDDKFYRKHLENIFDDYMQDRKLLFEYFGYQTGEQLLAKSNINPFDIVFSDVYMEESGGKLTGYEVIKNIKDLSPKTATFIISNEPATISKASVKKVGGNGAFEQPIERNQIFSILDRFLTVKPI